MTVKPRITNFEEKKKKKSPGKALLCMCDQAALQVVTSESFHSDTCSQSTTATLIDSMKGETLDCSRDRAAGKRRYARVMAWRGGTCQPSSPARGARGRVTTRTGSAGSSGGSSMIEDQQICEPRRQKRHLASPLCVLRKDGERVHLFDPAQRQRGIILSCKCTFLF